MTDTAMTEKGQQSTALVKLPDTLPDERPLQYVQRLMEMLPQATDDVVQGIAARILSAPTEAEENRMWDATGSKNAAGKRFVFHSVHAYPSDFEDSPLDYYLVCRVTDMDSGEKSVLTTGSVNICTSLVKAQVLGRLPWEAEIVAPKRTPKSGRVPLRLRWIARIEEPDSE